MKIEFSSVTSHESFVAYEVSHVSANDACGSFSIISSFNRGLKKDDMHEIEIINNKIFLTEGIKSSKHVLEIGNKCINQLILWQLGCYIPNTIALDFSFYEIYKKNGDVELKDVYDQYIQPFLGPVLAIRCSSNLEDGEKHSYAGVFDTYLNVENNFTGFQSFVLKVYEKFCSENDSVIVLSKEDIRIGIMIQKMVQPIFSGFLFTMDPLNPPNHWLKIEYWKGEREQSEGSSITLNRENGKRIQSDRDIITIPLPMTFQKELYHAAKKLKRYFGFPQDAEFLISDKDKQLYLVQSRPITAFNFSPDRVRLNEREKLSAVLKENLRLYQKEPILSSTNISELFDRAVPLGYSIFKYGFAGTLEEEGGISLGRSRLGYARLDFEDQINLFFTVADQARTNLIVDALTFRLPSIDKSEYLKSFVAYYLKQLEEDPSTALYPEDGLYLQDDQSEQWNVIEGEKKEIFRKKYSELLDQLINYHAPKEYQNASDFFTKNERFYRSHLGRDLHVESEVSLKKAMKKILKYLQTSFCPQYVVFARLAFLCTHIAKQKMRNLLSSDRSFPIERILNELLRSVDIKDELRGLDYPYFERLLKAGKLTLWEFLDRFQHIGSLDIHQPRLGEYTMEELQSIFGQSKHDEYDDGRLLSNDTAMAFDTEIIPSDLNKNENFRIWCINAGQFMRLREKAKSELLKVLYILKRIVKEIARLNRFGDQIYYLEYNEVLDLNMKNRDKLRLLALQRKAYFEASKQYQVKKVLMNFQLPIFEEKQFDIDENIDKRYKFTRGQFIYYGQAEGICLTAKSNEEYFRKLAAYMDNGVKQIIGVFKGVEQSFFNLSALVGFTTENGGYLAHASTIAREFRIPYITGIDFNQFQDGDYIIFDTENEQVIYRR